MAHLVRNLVEVAKPNLATFVKYAKVELTPPSPGDVGAISQSIKNIIRGAQSGRWKQLTVKEAWLNTLITVEVLCWFYIGECIGKRHFIGYEVKV